MVNGDVRQLNTIVIELQFSSSVASGVHCFKNYKYDEALKHFNYALEIDPENVEALVARGAL